LANATSYTPTVAGTYYAEARNIVSGCISSTRTGITLTINPNPSVPAIANQTICEGLPLTIAAAANGGWTYAWTKGGTAVSTANPLVINAPVVADGGTYQLVVTETATGCQATTTTSVTINPAVNATIVGTTITCSGGTPSANINTSVTGGTPAFTYSWTLDPSATVVSTVSNPTFSATGTYHLSVTDSKRCIGTASVNVVTPNPISTSNVVENVACNGASTGKITVSVSGGMLPFTIVYKKGATTVATHTATIAPVNDVLSALAAGTYTVEITDANGCMVSIMNIVITEPTVLTTTCAKTDETLYNVHDGTVNVNATGGSPTYTYLWSNGATTANQTGLTAGTYSVTVTDTRGCTAICTSTVAPYPCSPITMTPDPLPSGQVGVPYSVQVNATGGIAPYQFVWLPGTTGVLPAGLSMDNNGLVTGTPTKAGSYLVRVFGSDVHQCPAALDPVAINILCTYPTTTNTVATPATCTNGVPNSNGSIAITGIANGVKYSYGTNGTTGLFALNATTLTGNSITLSNLASPATATTYTFRIYGSDTSCYKDVTTVLNPSVCPPCSIIATFTQSACNNNGTTAITTDDFFTVTISNVTATNGGTTGKYEVMYNGTTLNTGGTPYGTSVMVGGILYFKSDNSTTYTLTVKDSDIPTCTATFTTAPSAPCSVVGCKPVICLPVTVTKF
jgi:SprB repeat